MVEQLICNQQVMGSSPFAGSAFLASLAAWLILGSFGGRFRKVERGAGKILREIGSATKRTGELPKRSKGTDCKSVGLAPSKVRILHSPLAVVTRGFGFAGVAQW